MDKLYWDLQLFAEGGAGAAGGDGGAAAGAGSETGAGASDAGEQKPQKKRRENPLANVRYGVQPEEPAIAQVATGEKEAAQGGTETARPSFEDLIKGEYKQEFGEKVQGIIRERFKTNAEAEERAGKMQPLLEALGRKYNVDPGDIDRLTQVIGDDDSLYEDEAMERGMSVESLKTIKQMERENAELKKREQRSVQEEQLRSHFNRLAQQAEEARKLYPGLDLRAEMQNPTFARLTAPGVDVDVRTAYEVVHREELRGAEMQYAAQKSAERMSNAIRSGSMRPQENGAGAQQSTATVKTDPRTLTKADREEIRRRAANGEKIVF